MEVHAHTHTPDPDSHRGRKKWTHYFWEFLMLFLAVFCGFLAEYQLEHRIEKERAKKYIRSFYEDLKTDTAEFANPIASYQAAVIVLEKRKDCYASLKMSNSSDSCLINLFEHSVRFTDLINADQTLLQLKNAGGFRLLDNSDADSILLYDKMIRLYIKEETTGFQQIQHYTRSLIFSLKNYEWNGEVSKDTRVIFSDNKELLNTYFNVLDRYDANCRRFLNLLLRIRENASRLIEFFKNKYHFK